MLLSLLSSTEVAQPARVECLLVFDPRLGGEEDAERKLLFCHPPDHPLDEQLRALGLCEALVAFSRRFSHSPCETVRTANRRYTLFEAEPSIWFVLVTLAPSAPPSAPRGAPDEAGQTPDGLPRERLRWLHATLALFLGPLTRIGATGADELRAALGVAAAPLVALCDERGLLLLERAPLAHALSAVRVPVLPRLLLLNLLSALRDVQAGLNALRGADACDGADAGCAPVAAAPGEGASDATAASGSAGPALELALVLHGDQLVWSELPRGEGHALAGLLCTLLDGSQSRRGSGAVSNGGWAGQSGHAFFERLSLLSPRAASQRTAHRAERGQAPSPGSAGAAGELVRTAAAAQGSPARRSPEAAARGTSVEAGGGGAVVSAAGSPLPAAELALSNLVESARTDFDAIAERAHPVPDGRGGAEGGATPLPFPPERSERFGPAEACSAAADAAGLAQLCGASCRQFISDSSADGLLVTADGLLVTADGLRVTADGLRVTAAGADQPLGRADARHGVRASAGGATSNGVAHCSAARVWTVAPPPAASRPANLSRTDPPPWASEQNAAQPQPRVALRPRGLLLFRLRELTVALLAADSPAPLLAADWPAPLSAAALASSAGSPSANDTEPLRWAASVRQACTRLFAPVEAALSEQAARTRAAASVEVAAGAPQWTQLDGGSRALRYSTALFARPRERSDATAAMLRTCALLASAHAEAQREQARALGAARGSSALPPAAARACVEVCARARTATGGWVIARRAGDRSSALLLDGKAGPSLEDAHAAESAAWRFEPAEAAGQPLGQLLHLGFGAPRAA
ncbi:hypothetical protein KFE25_002812 [Diacronema lutheri]|uniref:CCZ1/INTU/HSP4 first Longin domain-containing protein n=1 Tax=Diacronema lutheri TaxID=2081491 RepID=A0A8J5XU65_DIALT|nr:hypothetical protein KFE25_002812 [Diacronema lutheri]